MMDLTDFETEDREWKLSSKGNYVCIRDGGIAATVFLNPYGVWQIVLRGDIWGLLVDNEIFLDPEEAIRRAIEVLDGAECEFKRMMPRKTTTSR